MNQIFSIHGRKLLAGGFLIVPIRAGHKRPALDNWQHARLGAADLDRYPTAGVGVLCGQGAHPIAAIDIDTSDAALARRFADWCHENLGVTCERVGKAPKFLLPYRADAEAWGKVMSPWFEDMLGDRHRLEVLGKGQQFVAYHIHPDTGRPYEWLDFFGGLDEMRATDLPVLTHAQVVEAVAVFEQMAEEAGLAKKAGSTARTSAVTAAPDDDPLMTYEPPLGLAMGEASKLLKFVDNEDYDTWLKVGMSLHHEYEGQPEALQLWVEWSSSASNFVSEDDLALRWDSFGRGGARPTTARWLLKVGNANKREAQHAEKRGALEDAREQINTCQDSILLVNEVARRAGEAASGDMALKAELAGLIRKRFAELTKTPLPVADVRRAMAPAAGPHGRRQRRDRTEFGNAERMLDHYGDGLMYVPEVAAWYSWTGVYWRRGTGVELEHLAKETIRALPDELKDIDSDEEREAFFKFCAISQRAVMVRNMVSLARVDPRVVVPVDKLNLHNHFFGVANGAIDLRTGDLVAPDPAHRITMTSQVEYDPAAQAPLFEQTVSDVFNDDADMIGFFQRLVGYSMMGDPKEDILVIPYGSGSNGKSTVMGAIRAVMGDYAKTASAETFLTNGQGGANAGGAREDVLRLLGARFVYGSEPDEGSELRENLIKSMTGGDPIPARGLYATATIEVQPSWVVFMPTNHRPIVKGDDHAIWRRLLPVPFTRNFDKDPAIKKDTGRAAKLAAEAPGILRWCVEGALAYQQMGLKPTGQVQQAREDYKSDMDLLAEWLDECCEMGPNLRESTAALWESWQSFARSRGELKFIPTARGLGRRLAARFTAWRTSSERGFIGLRVKSIDSGDFT